MWIKLCIIDELHFINGYNCVIINREKTTMILWKGCWDIGNKLETISNLFEGNEIRSIWDSEKEDYYFSVIDVIGALTDNDYQKSRNYWKWLKNKLNIEGSELVSNTNQLKLRAQDGKMRETDVLDTKGIFRLIESIPSLKAEPMKLVIFNWFWWFSSRKWNIWNDCNIFIFRRWNRYNSFL